MTTESNKSKSRRFLEEAFNMGHLNVIDEIVAPNHKDFGPAAMPGLPDGPEGTKRFVTAYRKAFPDTHFQIDEQVAEGDVVITRWTAHGTQKGEMPMPGIPVTGKSVTVSGITIDRYSNGMIVETWGLFDQMGMMQQLGVVPGPVESGNQGQGKR